MELDPSHCILRAEANQLVIDSVALQRDSRGEEARTGLEHRISRRPPSPAAAAVSLLCRGMARMIERRTGEAVADLREAVRLYPYLAAPHIALAHVLLSDERWAEAFAEYQEAIRIDSEEGKFSYPRVRDLYVPLVRAFEPASQHRRGVSAALLRAGLHHGWGG